MTEPLQVPSVKQSTGVDFETYQWFGMLAAKQTPAPILEKLAKALSEANEDPDLRRKLKDQGLDSHGLYLKAFDEYMAKERNMWGPIVSAAGLKLGE